LEEKLLEYYKKNLRLWLEGAKDYIQVAVFGGDDLGTQVGPQISPRVYREMIQPYQKELYQYAKKSSNLFIFLHSCGSIYHLLPDIIDAGVDIINPVQISAKHMDPTRLKKEFGDKITFWGGGVDTQKILGACTPEEVSKNVVENIRAFASGGGFVFATVHNILANVPSENIIAVFDTVKKYGEYPIK
jgi:uroporphyrinogen decarboxylase